MIEDSENSKEQFMKTVLPLLDLAYEKGREQGFKEGTIAGFSLATKQYAPAISDGLRHGSPECGKVLRDLEVD